QAAGTPVDAAVDVMNPKMNETLNDGDRLDQGASDGDPGYTRVHQMQVRIIDQGDCTGLSAYRALSDAEDVIYQQGMITGTFVGALNAPLSPGETLFKVRVFDHAGNAFAFPRRIIFDPPGDSGEGRPVMNLSGTALTGDANTLTILRSLIINTIVVTDNLYRRGESSPTRGYVNVQTPPNASDPTKQFWGLWIAVEYLGKGANAETTYPQLPSGGLTFDHLRWQPVEVPHAAPGTQVRFNLFHGVLDRTASSPTNGFGPDLTKDGTYRVYVKALDGAGNASAETYVTTMSLDPGYTVVMVQLPFIQR
ncbi:MAG: hypothetical protein ACPLW7_06480, partial [Minisyncoccia bacterium]